MAVMAASLDFKTLFFTWTYLPTSIPHMCFQGDLNTVMSSQNTSFKGPSQILSFFPSCLLSGIAFPQPPGSHSNREKLKTCCFLHNC